MKKEADREYIKTPPPCVLRKENIGEVSRSDGGVEYTHIKTLFPLFQPLSSGLSPRFFPYITVVPQGRSEDSFTLLLCSAIAEKGEVSRSDGGVENLSGSVFLNPLACGAPPIFPLWRTQGESLNLGIYRKRRRETPSPAALPLYFLAENTGGEGKCNFLAFIESAEEETLRHCLRHSSIFSCRIHRGRGEFPFTSPAQELFRVKFFNNNFVV